MTADSFINLLAAEFFCHFHDVIGAQTKGLQHFTGGAGETELIVDTNALDGVIYVKLVALGID